MLHLELVTTAEDEKARMFEGDTEHGTAALRRLVDAYAGTLRIFCADSFFSSVKTAEILLTMDLKFIGAVKMEL